MGAWGQFVPWAGVVPLAGVPAVSEGARDPGTGLWVSVLVGRTGG